MSGRPVVGSTVRVTRDFMRNTGSVGSLGHSRWVVEACACGLCADGRFVAVDENSGFGSGRRHFNVGNIETCKAQPGHCGDPRPTAEPGR